MNIPVKFNGPYSVTINATDYGVVNSLASKEFFIKYLVCQRAYLNDLLHLNRVVTLNDVYKRLRMEETENGNLIGWSLDNPNSDRYVDFDLDSGKLYEFMHRDSMELTMDFNVDGQLSEDDLITHALNMQNKGEQ